MDIAEIARGWVTVAAAFAYPFNEQTYATLRREAASFPPEVACLLRAEEDVTDVRLAHQRMLVGPDPVRPSPWESVNRGEEGLVFDENTFEVREFYRRFGLQSSHLNRFPEDHVAIEAEFLAHLLSLYLEQEDERYVEGFRQFIAAHAGLWLPQYFADFYAASVTDYHRAIALIGQRTVQADV